ncbi:hypothetical protein TK45_07485 [Bowmanella sp. JS7-9]|nr:hypothetical protein TK45_07485 [Bowmanella sp. JS7-9]
MNPRVEQQDDRFSVDIFRFDGDHQAIVEEEVDKAKICENGYEILSTKQFAFGCPVFGILPADCVGTSYIGQCKNIE